MLINKNFSNTAIAYKQQGNKNKNHKNEPGNKESGSKALSPYKSSKVSFGCMFCALAALASTKEGNKMMGSFVPDDFDYIGPAPTSKDALYNLLVKNAKAQSPPIPFDAGNRTQFLTYAQMQKQMTDRIKSDAAKVDAEGDMEDYIEDNGPLKPETSKKLYDKYNKFLDGKHYNILDKNREFITETYDPFANKDSDPLANPARNIYFLTSFNFDPDIGEHQSGSTDTDEIPEVAWKLLFPNQKEQKAFEKKLEGKVDKDENGNLVTHSVCEEDRQKFSDKAPVLPYGYIMTSSIKSADGDKYVTIEDANNYKFMESSNAQLSALERFIATLADKNINIESRPLRFDKNGNVDKSKPLKSTRPNEGKVQILLTEDLMEKLPKETQELLKRPVLSDKKIKLATLRLLQAANSAIIREAKKIDPKAKPLEFDPKKLAVKPNGNPEDDEEYQAIQGFNVSTEAKKQIDNIIGNQDRLDYAMLPDTEDPDIDSEQLNKAIKAERLKAVISVINYFERSEGEPGELIKRYPENLTKIFEKTSNILNRCRGLGFKSLAPVHHVKGDGIPYSITIDYSKDGKEKIKDLLYNIRAGVTENRNLHIAGDTDDGYQDCDPAFVPAKNK